MNYYYGSSAGAILELPSNLPSNIIFQDEKETVVLKFDDKAVVVRANEDVYSREYGFLLAYFQHHSGLSKNKANKYIKNLANIPSQDKRKK